jgi:hypothetical protein
MSFVTKPDRVNPKERIKSDTINKIIQGLEDIESYLENLVTLVKDHLEYGKVSNIPTSSVTTLTYNITFTKPFSSNPLVFLSIENLNPYVDISYWVSNVSTTGFSLNVKVIRVRPDTYVNVNWLALL